MELRQLRYFIAVAEEGHITRAADRLGIQQPPLSRLIKALENDLDVRLFVRKPRGVELTEAGLAFYREATQLIASVDNAVETTRSTARGERGRICVGVSPTGPFVPFVPEVIRTFRRTFPNVNLSLEERLSSELVELVRNGRIDVALLWTPRAEGLASFPLVDDPLVVALPSEHPLAQSSDKAISVKALAGETFIVYGRKDGFGLYAATIVACRTAGFSPRFGQESARLASALNLVAVGLGVFFVPSSVQRIDMQGVTYKLLKGPNAPRSTLNIVCRRNELSTVVNNFVGMARKAARQRGRLPAKPDS
ncbi:LysR family transcriptional regulator [Bradyrhizobium diazoefficiens]|nr:LysR family transcriptional regulator [Bradyrhizobium diazoefficiens]UCF53378.1 MAG: LysR family transcriptional regulator [Bradyrhizobium sp.]MBR0962954.1 LysR family transcriptional regulator [Bradyrhizobium diazoefficiens]MBR0977114.1 LysR family transcriptional regulator [Bradyrhizobium diazoefficiens]MBR1005759.1 LysR family transcriptional regulator [Bradyrhizobium diazoefficiens]MBR1012232.1 LysR family transcriptional regulator [Bradyrhizobium diazoefficiens]